MRAMLVLMFVGLLGSCNSLQVITANGDGLPCQEDGDCSEGLECIDSMCARPQVSDGGSGDGGAQSCSEAVDCANTCTSVSCYEACGDGLCQTVRERWVTYKICIAGQIAGSCSTVCTGGIGTVGCRSCASTACDSDLQNCLNERC